MTIARETVLHVAELASLSLGEDEIASLTRDLDAIVRYVDELEDVDTEGVEPASTGVLGVRATAPAWRKDEVREGLSHDDALAQAPHAEDGGFAVPVFVDPS